MSDTPRTDAAIKHKSRDDMEGLACTAIELARTMEHELTSLRARLAEAEAIIWVYETASGADCVFCDHDAGENFDDHSPRCRVRRFQDGLASEATEHAGGVCEHPSHPEWHGQPCACVTCHPVGFCVETPCLDCTGPASEQCQPPDDDDDAEVASAPTEQAGKAVKV
jgi:hypothetical protein